MLPWLLNRTHPYTCSPSNHDHTNADNPAPPNGTTPALNPTGPVDNDHDPRRVRAHKSAEREDGVGRHRSARSAEVSACQRRSFTSAPPLVGPAVDRRLTWRRRSVPVLRRAWDLQHGGCREESAGAQCATQIEDLSDAARAKYVKASRFGRNRWNSVLDRPRLPESPFFAARPFSSVSALRSVRWFKLHMHFGSALDPPPDHRRHG